MEVGQSIINYSLRHYKLITVVMAVFTLELGAILESRGCFQ
jgi:hypothetical protein